MILTSEQYEALQQARTILKKAGLLNSPPGSPNTEAIHLKDLCCLPVKAPFPPKSSHLYLPLLATPFSSEDILNSLNWVTAKGYAQKIIEHPPFTVVEFPETGTSEEEVVAHIFPVSPGQKFDPKLNVQYSVWGKHGSHDNVTCYLLKDKVTSLPPLCHQFKEKCKLV